ARLPSQPRRTPQPRAKDTAAAVVAVEGHRRADHQAVLASIAGSDDLRMPQWGVQIRGVEMLPTNQKGDLTSGWSAPEWPATISKPLITICGSIQGSPAISI